MKTLLTGRGFLADVCVEWEHEALAAERLGIRVVCVRTDDTFKHAELAAALTGAARSEAA